MVSTEIIPSNERERMAAVSRYEILDSPPDGAFDRVTALAARRFNVPIAIISIVDSDRIWFKSHHGVDVEQVDREPGLCASAILRNEPHILLDASTDIQSLANPLVAGVFGLRFYAGVPLQTCDGFNLGTLCVIDKEARPITQDQIEDLKDLASIVMDQLELRLSARRALANADKSLVAIKELNTRLLRAIRAQRREREARFVTGDAVAAAIAHEIKQPLASMVTRSHAALRWLDRPRPDLDNGKAELRHIAADGRRASEVIESIRANFRKDARGKTSLEIDDLIRDSVGLLRDDLHSRRILVQVDTGPQKQKVVGDRIQLQQVLLNLITNAMDSMSEKDGSRVLCVKSAIRKDGDIEVSVEDTGTGIAEQDEERIFNPLFTTKAGGMGMGLSICRSIVEAHGGKLWAAPNTPEGTVFRFDLRPAP